MEHPPDDDALDQRLRGLPDLDGPPDAGEACIDDGLLLAWRAGTASVEAASAIERHLLHCADCRALWVQLAEPVAPGLQAALEHGLRPRPRVVTWAGLAAVGALAAGLLFVVLGRGPASVPEYHLDGPTGGVQTIRGAGGAGTQFLPDSLIAASIRPDRDAPATPPWARVYVARDPGPLAAAPPDVLQPGEGGVFVLESSALRLFGETPGRYAVYVVIGPGGDPPPALEGLSAAEAERRAAGSRWLRFEVDYQVTATP